MILKNYLNTQIIKDNDDIFNRTWFDIRDKKVIHNIDTLYCTCDVKGDYNALAPVRLVPYLEDLKKELEFESIYLQNYGFYFRGLSFQQYCFCLEKKDHYLFFFSRKKNTDSTPAIFIQIRSEALWLYGEHQVLNMMHEDLQHFLDTFGIEVACYQENRIDFAYHTNYVKNMTSFFNLEKLNAMQVSNFNQFGVVGKLRGDSETKTEYISYGKRTSNNLFVRIYDKTTEVCEQGYKQFFLSFWHSEGLINSYDKYIYEKCFLDKGVHKLHHHRIKFYIDFGQDYKMLEYAKLFYIGIEKKEYDEVKALADTLTPSPTVILNFEFQTKRKFYYTFSKEILNSLGHITNPVSDSLLDLFKLLDNKILIHNLLTQDVFRLVDITDNYTRKRDKCVSPLWKLIQDVNMNYKTDVKMLRKYQRNLDLELIKKRLANQLATFSLYLQGENNNDVIQDSLNFMSYLNESDIEKAINYKKKKAPLLKDRVSADNVEIESRYALLDKEDGTIIE